MSCPSQRLINRLSRHGPDALSTAELLAIVLGQDRVAACRRALDRYGNGRVVAANDVSLTARLTGLPPADSARLVAAFALHRRFVPPEHPGPPSHIYHPSDVQRLLAPVLENLPTEQLHGLYLDGRQKILAHHLLADSGLPDRVIVHPRAIFRPALALHARYVLLVHNHPGGDPSPSAADHDLTTLVDSLAEPLGLSLLDHVILAGQRLFSFRTDQRPGHRGGLGGDEDWGANDVPRFPRPPRA